MNKQSHSQRFVIRDKVHFEELFREYYERLCAYGNYYVKELPIAEEIAQEVLYALWSEREKLVITGSISAYLFRAVRNKSLNHLKHLQVRETHRIHEQHAPVEFSSTPEEEVIGEELNQHIQKAIERLPAQRRKAFVYSRYHDLSYREIAEKMEISIKTVEKQVGSALRQLRIDLQEYLPFVLFVFLECK